MRSSFPFKVHARGCVSSSRAYVRKRVHNATEQAQAKKYISTGAPQAQMYSPNYLRIAVPRPPAPRRAATFSSLALYLRRRICMECIHMKSTILPPTSSSPFSSPLSLPPSLSLFLLFRLSLFRALSYHALVYAVTSSGSLCSAVNPTEDTLEM